MTDQSLKFGINTRFCYDQQSGEYDRTMVFIATRQR